MMARRLYDGAVAGLGFACGAAIAALAVMVSVDVVARNLGWGNFPWLIEVAEYGLFVTTLLAAPWVLHCGAHVRVDLLSERLGPRASRTVDGLAELLGLAISVCLGYYGARVTYQSWQLEEKLFQELVVSEWWLLCAVPMSAALLGVEFVRRLRLVMLRPRS